MRILIWLAVLLLGAATHLAALSADRLRIDGLVEPMAIESDKPLFHWSLVAPPGQRNVVQWAYRIQAASSEEKLGAGTPDVWDSGMVRAAPPGLATYNGRPLVSTERVFWRVRLWESPNAPGPWSATGWFETGLQRQGDWTGPWIMLDPGARGQAASYLRGRISLDRPFTRARAYVSGLGWNEIYVNGERIGDRALDPAQTDYDKRCFYSADDITTAAKKGDFHRITVGVILGDGWFNQNRVWGGLSYGEPRLRAEFVFTHADGSETRIAADPSWKARTGPILNDNVYAGETYDARQELGDWSTAQASDAGWKPVVQAPELATQMVAESVPPVRCVRTIAAKNLVPVSPGTWVYDFGENVSGWEQMKIAAEPGTQVRLRFAERTKPDGTLDTITGAPLVLGCEQVDTYTAKGDPAGETWQPRFTCHGFRYAELTVVSGKLVQPPSLQTLSLLVLHTDFEVTGSFTCSDEHLNDLHAMAVRTMLDNDQGVPGDCPIRERCGWTGDAHTVVRYELDNADAATFFRNYARDIQTGASDGGPEETQSTHGFASPNEHVEHPPAGLPHMIAPGKRTCNLASPDWGCAIVLVPWQVYVSTGDRAGLESFRRSMEIWAEWELSRRDDRGMLLHGLGDWCAPTMPQHDWGDWIGTREIPITSTGFFILSLRDLARVEELAGEAAAARRYQHEADATAAKWSALFFKSEDLAARSETALAFGIKYSPDPALRAKIYAALVAKTDGGRNFTTGIFGTPLVLKFLSERGDFAIGRTLLTKPEMPSYRAIHDQGATTLWESWPDAAGHDDGSLCHPMQGGFDAWLYEQVAGLAGRASPDEPWRFCWNGNAGLSFARAEQVSAWGPVRSAWKRENGTVTWQISVPPGMTADVEFPLLGHSGISRITEGGKPIAGRLWLLGSSPSADVAIPREIVRIGSGDYTFAFPEKS